MELGGGDHGEDEDLATARDDSTRRGGAVAGLPLRLQRIIRQLVEEAEEHVHHVQQSKDNEAEHVVRHSPRHHQRRPHGSAAHDRIKSY